MKTLIAILVVLLLAGGYCGLASTQRPPENLVINEAKWTIRMVDEFPSDDDVLGWTDMHKHEILLKKECVSKKNATLSGMSYIMR